MALKIKVMEGFKDIPPSEEFLDQLRELTSENQHHVARKLIADTYFGEGSGYSVMLQACIDVLDKHLNLHNDGVDDALFGVSVDMTNGMFRELEKKVGVRNAKLIRRCL